MSIITYYENIVKSTNKEGLAFIYLSYTKSISDKEEIRLLDDSIKKDIRQKRSNQYLQEVFRRKVLDVLPKSRLVRQ